ncbi:hypothetical protein ISG33_04655 [Glaciecola sp. MH2013]|uniref:SxtJ family membrane protein n=1 Tax=Glaciecola sp. MH2013 TaxID=2785524 RepID=UPI00189D7145|nr:SxtJ family membrane protein [Glaciecola sp. MH2013]MBF7072688.1 hypothetical protein [Glaciecola sp. MH2013]
MYSIIKTIMLPLASKQDIPALRSFAVVMSSAFPIVFMLLLPWLFNHSMPWWPLAVPLILMLLHLFLPQALYFLYLAWMILASILGWFNTQLLLAIIYYGLITPIGLVMRALGKLQYKKRLQTGSSWVIREHNDYSKDKKRLEEPF